MSPLVPVRQVRAAQTEDTLTVYQAYSPDIAEPALAAGTFVPPFKRDRMTWLKPSFLWMAYRCGWATKAGQERVLAVGITKTGFAWALAHSCLSSDDRDTYPDHATWARRLRESSVRVQWDPERGLRHEPLAHRAIQVGLTGEAVHRYVTEWIVSITDVTPLMRTVAALVAERRDEEARAVLPSETEHPLAPDIAAIVGASVH